MPTLVSDRSSWRIDLRIINQDLLRACAAAGLTNFARPDLGRYPSAARPGGADGGRGRAVVAREPPRPQYLLIAYALAVLGLVLIACIDGSTLWGRPRKTTLKRMPESELGGRSGQYNPYGTRRDNGTGNCSPRTVVPVLDFSVVPV